MSITQTDRRRLLKGLGLGGLLFHPFIRSLGAEAATGQPKLIIMYTPNGFHMPRMTVNKAGTGAAPDRPVFSNSLLPLETAGHSSKVLVLRNLDSTLDSDGVARSHEQQSALITGFSTKMNNGDKHFQVAQGPSIDWTIAKSLGQEPLGLSVMFSPSTTYKHLWSAKGVPNDPVEDPRILLDRLFPSSVSAADANKAAADARKLVIQDALIDDTRKLRARLGADDRQRIDPYLEGLENFRASLTRPPPMSTCPAPPNLGAHNWTSDAQWKARGFAQLDVIIKAFQCGYRSVATLSFGYAVAGANVSDVGNSEHHAWSHSYEFGYDSDKTIARIDRVYAEFYAEMLTRLQTAGLLDDVMVLWMSELTDGNYHNQDNRQWLVAGGGAGKLRTGRVIDSNGGANDRCTNKLCVTLARAMGMNITTFGDATRMTEGPLSGTLT